jgi:glucose-1-phosphate thymidylyltransferase
MLPTSEITNKHLMPVYSQSGAVPMIWYPLHTLLNSGCKDVLIISSHEHSGDIIDFIGDGHRFGFNSVSYKIQDHNRIYPGIASALSLSKDFVGDDPFAVILGDNFYQDTFKTSFDYFDRRYDPHYRKEAAHIFIKKVHDPQRFGVATMDGNLITKIVEKPKEPESDMAVTGLYLYTPHVFELLPKLTVSARGELEITDINQWYVQNKTMGYTTLDGFWHDMGTPESMIRTQNFINENNYKVSFQ